MNQPIRLLPFLAFVLIKEKKVTTMSKKARKAICYTQVIADLILKANNISPQMSSTSTRQHPSHFLFSNFFKDSGGLLVFIFVLFLIKKNHETSVWQLNNSFLLLTLPPTFCIALSNNTEAVYVFSQETMITNSLL